MKKWDEIYSLEFRLGLNEREIRDGYDLGVLAEVKERFKSLGFDIICYWDIVNICLTLKSKEYWDVIMEYLNIATEEYEIFNLCQCFMTKSAIDYAPYFIDKIKKCKRGQQMIQISYANVLIYTASPLYLDDYIDILHDEDISVVEPPLDDIRSWIFQCLYKIKSNKSEDVYLHFLNDDRFTARCIKGLGTLVNEKYRSLFEEYRNSEDYATRKYSREALKKLDKQKEKK